MDEHDENQEEGAGSMPVHSVSDISELEISTIAADTTEPDLTESISTSISVQTDSLITKPVGSQTSWVCVFFYLEHVESENHATTKVPVHGYRSH